MIASEKSRAPYFERLNKRLVFLNSLFVGFALLMPLHRDLGKYTIIVMIIASIFCLDFKKYYYLITEKRVLKALLAFFLFLCASILWSDNTGTAFEWVYFMAKYLFLVIFIVSGSLHEKFMLPIIHVFLFSMLINMVATYYMYFNSVENILSLGFTEHNSYLDYSIFSVFSIYLSLYCFVSTGNRYLKYYYLLFIISMTVNLFMSEGRTGQLAFILTSLVLVFIYFKKNIKQIIYALLANIVLLLMAYSFSYTFHERVNLAFSNVNDVLVHADYNSSIGIRLSAYKILPEILKENNVVLGVGVGDVRSVVHDKYIQTFGRGKMFDDVHGYVHNTFLSILIALGLIGLSLYLFFLYDLLKLQLKDEKLNIVKYSLVCTIVFSSFSDNLLGQMSVLMLFALFFSVLLVSSLKSSENPKVNYMSN